MNKGKELAKNTAIISIGKISTQMISFLLLPLYTAVLSTEEYGVVDLVVTYVHLLLPICTLQLEQSIFRFVLDKRKDEQEKKRIFSEIFTLAIIAVVFFSVIYIAISPLIHSEFKYYLLINLIANIYGQLMLQSARGLGKNAAYHFCCWSGGIEYYFCSYSSLGSTRNVYFNVPCIFGMWYIYFNFYKII